MYMIEEITALHMYMIEETIAISYAQDRGDSSHNICNVHMLGLLSPLSCTYVGVECPLSCTCVGVVVSSIMYIC
jgi:hypothetical protein